MEHPISLCQRCRVLQFNEQDYGTVENESLGNCTVVFDHFDDEDYYEDDPFYEDDQDIRRQEISLDYQLLDKFPDFWFLRHPLHLDVIVSIVCNGSKACIRDKGNTVSRNLDRGILYQPSLATPRHEIIGSLRTPLDDEESIAPSWSWVSNPNPVKWGGETNNFDPLFMCQSKIASINMKTNLNPYGQYVADVRFDWTHDSSEAQTHSTEKEKDILNMLSMVLILRYDGEEEDFMMGLLVLPTNMPSVYRRSGLFSCENGQEFWYNIDTPIVALV
ncbi:uncharacterized protein BO96DRAFT_398823 [Aspergillus niger CBS 101883]|uniref:Contig An14c0180, genomic contig n=2 Tax=Aspergillus niger TaxID=5061 RepID=A2R3V5_ASPNC|nr:uncharacterized protein BO96DRAFT_398823 [Aspergillus niger CBS 101883]XP_059602367.1 uncharacterized protein An14g05620 [Aspergillus niger]PYH54086.1 hypothetical protein BO96DRAFT_398823 [Aspergillus niger CBS 101883]CAK42123.1 unnamed protein product [Aspergillus niger]